MDNITNELKEILNEMDNISVRIHKVNYNELNKMDRCILLYNIQELALTILNQSKLKQVG